MNVIGFIKIVTGVELAKQAKEAKELSDSGKHRQAELKARLEARAKEIAKRDEDPILSAASGVADFNSQR